MLPEECGEVLQPCQERLAPCVPGQEDCQPARDGVCSEVGRRATVQMGVPSRNSATGREEAPPEDGSGLLFVCTLCCFGVFLLLCGSWATVAVVGKVTCPGFLVNGVSPGSTFGWQCLLLVLWGG